MADILPFKRKKPSEVHKGKTLCKRGFHKWKVETGQKFDVKKGKLITVLTCERCGARKSEAR